MKRTLAISLLALSLSTNVLAGEVPSPGKTDPPCTQNCGATAPIDSVVLVVPVEETIIPVEFIDLVLTLLTLR